MHRTEGGGPPRRRAAALAVVTVALAGIAAAPLYGPQATVPAAFALAAVLGAGVARPVDARRVALLAGAAGAVSLADTVAVLCSGRTYRQGATAAGGLALCE